MGGQQERLNAAVWGGGSAPATTGKLLLSGVYATRAAVTKGNLEDRALGSPVVAQR